MLQILVWGVCVLILIAGACASSLERLDAGDKRKGFTGVGIWIFAILMAILLFVLSLAQGSSLANLLK